MFKLFFSVLILIIIAPVVNAQTFIALRHHVPNFGNRSGGYCGWAALETLTRHYGYGNRILYNRIQSGKGGPSYTSNLTGNLARRGIPFHAYQNGVMRFPAVVTLNYPKMAHAVILQAIDRNYAYIYDPNHPGRITYMSRQEFNRRWAGNTLTIGR